MLSETKRQKIERIKDDKKLLNETYDHNIIFCWQCLSMDNKIVKIKDCTIHRHGYSIKWCDKEESFECFQGILCKSCFGKKYGFGNPETHQKTIDSQIKSGSFNMLDPKVQKTKTSNSNLLRMKLSFCKACEKETYHLGNRCIVCNPFDNGIKIKYCQICKEYTQHNGNVCCVCNPSAISIGFKTKLCKVCGKETYHLHDRCFICDPWDLGFLDKETQKNALINAHKSKIKKKEDLALSKGYISYKYMKFEENSILKTEFKTFEYYISYINEESIIKLNLSKQEALVWRKDQHAIRSGFKSSKHMQFEENNILKIEFKTFEKYQLFLEESKEIVSKLSKLEFLAWRKDKHAIRHGYKSYISMWCNNKKQQLLNQFKTLDINKIVSILSDSSTDWDKRQNKAYNYVTELGNIDYFAGKRIPKNELIYDNDSNICVYGLKLLKNNKIIYIGETINFDNRHKEHQNNIKINNYNKISKYITSDMIESTDIVNKSNNWKMIKLATPSNNILESSKYKIKYWLSLVECQLIHDYGTNKLANNETGTW